MMKGIPCPLANRKPEEIDFWVVRENNEGEYSEIGGRLFQGTDREMALQESIFTRLGVDRVLRFAFDLAKTRKKKHLTSQPIHASFTPCVLGRARAESPRNIRLSGPVHSTS